jgi:hypothetical protein
MRTPRWLILACSLAPLAGCRGNQPPATDGDSPSSPSAASAEPTIESPSASETGAPELQPEPQPGVEVEPQPEPAAGETGGEPSPDPTLAAELAQWGGDAPVLLVWTSTSLLATTGKRERVLVEAPIEMASYDPARRVIWYASGTQLRALDLLAATIEPRTIVDKLPPDRSISLADAGVWMGDMQVPEYLVLRWDEGKVRIELGLSFDEIMNEHIAKAIRAAKLGDRAWLEALAERAPLPLPAPPKLAAVEGAPLGDCDDEEPCGYGVAWPGSSWSLYVTNYDCGDYCHWSCGLWDAKTKRTADPATLPSPVWDASATAHDGHCGPFHTDAGASAVVVGDRLCRGDRCTELSGHALGFIDPGPTIAVEPD